MFKQIQLGCIHLKPSITGSMVAHWSAVSLTQIGLYHLITAVSYVQKTWNKNGHFNNKSDRLTFSINKAEDQIKNLD